MNMFLFLILAWYLDSILPDEYGVRQKPFFFIHKSYWGYDNSEQENQSRDLQTWQSMASAHYIQNSAPKPSKGSLFTRLFRRPNTFTSKTSSDTTLSPASSLEQKPCADIEVSLLRDAAHDISTPAALRVVHLRKVFGNNFVAVNDSNFVMHQGELLAVLGANGSGKSTTCHILCGITPATAGDALVDDSISLLGNIGGKNSVGWCPQHDILFDELTPIASIRGVGREEAKIVGEERLKRVRLWHRRDGRVGTFSGGMRRRLSMVLSTIGDPKLVILDEVTTGLDPVSILP
jgi:ABC-type glutathione transport system ATPase component